ncbi:acyltransferase [Porphyromonadaceae bacterium]
MNFNELKLFILNRPKLKKLMHRLIIDPKQTAPRLWIRLFVNPFFNRRERGSVIKCSAKLNVSPINSFSLGKSSVIEFYCVIDNAVGNVIIGSNTRIGLGSTLIGPVQIGDNVLLAQNVVVSGMNHSYEDIDIPIANQGYSTDMVTVEEDVWIGANSVITSGVSIGTHSIVAGGSVVVKSVPPYCVVAGNPARVIKRYDFSTKKWLSVNE